MIRSETKLRAWGNSVGVVLPKDKLEEEGLHINDDVEVIVLKKKNVLRMAFGRLKGIRSKSGKSVDAILKEIDKELDPV